MGICCYSICGAICFSRASSKSLEITSIILNSISLLFLLLCLIMIDWKELSTANLVFFLIMLFLNVAYLIFSILLRIWRSKNMIKTLRKKVGVSLAVWGLVLIIINFIACLIEEIVFSIGVNRANYPCYNNDDSGHRDPYYYYYRRVSSVDCSGKNSDYYTEAITFKQFFIAYLTFSYLEIILILDMTLFCILKNRINLELDGPAQLNIPPQMNIAPQAVDQYGRAVVVVQPGDVVMMGGNQYQYNPYMQNQQNVVPPVNPQYPGSNDFQIQEKVG